MDLFGDLPEPTINNGSTPFANDPKFENLSNSKQSIGKRESKESEEIEFNKKIKLSNEELFTLMGCCVGRRGEREEMQDAHCIIQDFKTQQPSRLRKSLYCVFDGHGGKNASQYASLNLQKIIAAKYPKDDSNFEKDAKKFFIESFKQLDEDFLNEARKRKPSWKDGTTAVVVLALDNVLYIANLGDSKAVLCRWNESQGKYMAVPLSVDHNPTLYEERMRIQRLGGHVKEGRVMGILEVSRSIGDGPFKLHGVICTPDVKRCQLTSNDRFVLIACDGLWKSFADETAIEFVNSILDDDKIEASSILDTACTRLANEAVRRLSADNVTVLLVSISPHLKNGSSSNNSDGNSCDISNDNGKRVRNCNENEKDINESEDNNYDTTNSINNSCSITKCNDNRKDIYDAEDNNKCKNIGNGGSNINSNIDKEIDNH